MSHDMTCIWGTPCVAVIEWGEGSDPDVLVAASRLAVMRRVVDVFRACHNAGEIINNGVDIGTFLAKHPWPADDNLAEWLDALQEDSTVPWVTLVDLDPARLTDDLDMSSSQSRQHFIETGRYLWRGEVS